jgi:hypothetical protein
MGQKLKFKFVNVTLLVKMLEFLDEVLINKDVLHFANRNIIPSRYTYNQFYFIGKNLKYNQYSVQNHCI